MSRVPYLNKITGHITYYFVLGLLVHSSELRCTSLHGYYRQFMELRCAISFDSASKPEMTSKSSSSMPP